MHSESLNHKILKVFNDIVGFFALDMCSTPILFRKIAQKGTNCLRLLESQKLAPYLKSCQAQSGQAYQGIHNQLNDELADVGGVGVGRGAES